MCLCDLDTLTLSLSRIGLDEIELDWIGLKEKLQAKGKCEWRQKLKVSESENINENGSVSEETTGNSLRGGCRMCVGGFFNPRLPMLEPYQLQVVRWSPKAQVSF